MSLTKELNTEKYSTKSQRFDELLEEGISLIQKFSGENWTDYNYHDPGITILAMSLVNKSIYKWFKFL